MEVGEVGRELELGPLVGLGAGEVDGVAEEVGYHGERGGAEVFLEGVGEEG